MRQFLNRAHKTGVRAYTPDIPETLFRLALLGATNENMAHVLGVSLSTIDSWLSKYPECKVAIQQGRDDADAQVAKALFQRALGYEMPEEKIFCNSDGEVTRVQTVKRYPPDVTAIIFWLKNRQVERWRDRKDHVHGGAVELREVLEEIYMETELLAEAVEVQSAQIEDKSEAPAEDAEWEDLI